ncbi:MAG: hypothetical protein O7A09_04205, partial [Proteobacteria bacterium]|nr:hypothetical protein [Pseudomonadota bacterium]
VSIFYVLGVERRGVRTSHLAVAGVVFSLCYVLNAYVSDDAFISFRVADNLVRGYGLRWNPLERVQVFTSPLHTLLFSGVYWFSHDPSPLPNPTRAYLTAQVLSYAISLTGVLWLFAGLRCRHLAWPLFLLLLSSQAFVTFTSSGLETPLVYLLLIVFYTRYLRAETSSLRDLFWLFLCASLSVVSRIDTALLLFPACLQLAVAGARAHRVRLLGPVLLASLPMLAWFGFALVYFGSLLPNTYFAKIGLDVEGSILWRMGAAYLGINAIQDPLTLSTLVLGLAVSLRRWRTALAGAGALSYVLYIVSIGGDFLGFRYLAPPFLIAVLLIDDALARWRPASTRRVAAFASAGLLLYGLVLPGSTLRAARDLPRAHDVRFYFEASNPTRWRPGARFPFAPFHTVADPERCRALRADSFRVSITGGGLAGFCRGPLHHLVMRAGITDPLIARLPLRVTAPFLPGHLPKPVPAGYVETRRSGENRIPDPSLAAYFDAIDSVVSGPVFAWERWRHIARLHLTPQRRYRDPYPAAPDEPTVLHHGRRPSLVDRFHEVRSALGSPGGAVPVPGAGSAPSREAHRPPVE